MTVIWPYWIPYRTDGDELVKGYGTGCGTVGSPSLDLEQWRTLEWSFHNTTERGDREF